MYFHAFGGLVVNLFIFFFVFPRFSYVPKHYLDIFGLLA